MKPMRDGIRACEVITSWQDGNVHHYISNNKKLRYSEEHSTSAMLSLCTLRHFSGENMLMANRHFYVMGPKIYRIWRNNAKKGHYSVQGHLRSDFGTNRKPICDFVLVTTK